MELDLTLKMTILTLKMLGIDGFSPVVSESSQWTRWQTNFGPRTCAYCAEMHGDIFHKNNPPYPMPGEVHPNCNCALIVLLCIEAGTATIDGLNGADYYIKHYGFLPENYLSKSNARSIGWRRYKGNLRDVTLNGSIGGDIYYNDDEKLPIAANRTWYEADINYTGGYRNTHRILYSNDGLIFVTYDHYETFYEIK